MPTFTHDASVKHFRHESKALLKALEAGNTEAAARISRSLPRLADASVEDVLAAGVGLQEIQHVIAREQGCSQWRDLVDDDAPRFESITELSDADIRVLLREVGPRDMALALQGLVDGPMSKRHQAMFGMLQQLSETVHDELRSQVKSMELDVIAIAEAQSRIAQQARTLEVKGMIGKAAAQPENDARLPAPNLPAGLDVWDRPLHGLSVEEIRTGLCALARAHEEGLLEAAIPEGATGIVWDGVRMTVDGFEPPLLEDIVETHARTALRQLRLRLSLTIEAIIATAHGDNPKIVRPKLAPIYTVDPNTTYRDVEGTVELARQRLERTPASTTSLDELTELFTDVAWISWRANALRGDGFRVLEEVATAVDDEFIAWGLRLLAEHRRWQRRTDDKYRVVINRIMDDMETGMARRLDEAKRRYQLVSAGIVAIADGRGARIDEVLDEVTSG